MSHVRDLVNQNNILKLIILTQAAEIAALKETAEDAAHMIEYLEALANNAMG